MDTLWGIGVRTLGDVLALPRDGFARRFGANLLDQIDRARGHLPDARALFVAPERYHGQLELPSPVHETEALLFAVRRLVVELAGFLTGAARASPACASISCTRTCRRHRSSSASRPRARSSTCRTCCASAWRSCNCRIASRRSAWSRKKPRRSTAKEGELFQGSGKDVEAGTQLIERLRARLGEGAVHALALHADHRPERAQATSQGTQASVASHEGERARPWRRARGSELRR